MVTFFILEIPDYKSVIETGHSLTRCNHQALIRDEKVPMGYLTAESIVICSAESWPNVRRHLITDEKVPMWVAENLSYLLM